MTTTPNLGQSTWDPGNAQPDLLYNSLLSTTDALAPTPCVADKDLTAPPGSPAPGSLYIVASPATGLWVGKEGNLVSYTYANAWMFFSPKDGWLVRVLDEDADYRFDGSVWNIESGGGSGIPDAPSDGTIYGRQNSAWVDVGAAVSGVSDVNGATGAITLAQGSNVTIVESPTGTFTFNATGGGGGLANVPWKDFVTDYGADPTFTSDCGPAWDAYVADVVANGSLALYAQAGHYKFSRALQNTGVENAQMPLPRVNYVAGAPLTIFIFGGELPPCPTVSVITTEPDYGPGLTIFESTLTGASGSMIAGGSSGSFTNIFVKMKNLIIRTIPNPTISALDFENVACCDLDGVLVDTGQINVSGVTTPTTATSFGIKGPANNNGANTVLGTADIVGFYNGYQFSEHTIGLNVKAWACINAAVFMPATHSSAFLRFMPVHCKNGFVGPTSGAHVVSVQEYNAEHATSGPFTAVYDIDDTGNRLYGELKWRVVDAGVGGTDHYYFHGGRNIDFQPLAIANFRAVTTTGDTAGIYDAGRVIGSTNGSPSTMTIAPDSSVPWKLGSVLTWVQQGAGQITIAAGAGVTVHVPDNYTSRKQYSTVQAVNIGTDEWTLCGDYT